MAGLTPFQFSSNLLQNQAALGKSGGPLGALVGGVVGGLANVATGGLFSDIYQTMASWYEMWVNPAKIIIQSRYIQTRQQTAGSIVTFHFRQDVKVIQVSGVVGWIQIQSDVQSVQTSMFNLLKGDTKGLVRSLDNLYGSFKQGLNLENNRAKLGIQLNKWNPSNPVGLKLKGGRHGNTTNNSPRMFMQRLKDLADQPMYYYDDAGLEHYNIKYIKMYTKQFPTGVIAEGYFQDFEVPEAETDTQTINYSFTFIAENMKPITIAQRVPGMFTGSTNLIGDVIRTF